MKVASSFSRPFSALFSTLRGRIVIFMILMAFFSILGLYFMGRAQERLAATSLRVREQFLPTGRLINRARSEIDVQLSELNTLVLSSKGAPTFSLGMLRLTPSTRALMQVFDTPLLPRSIHPLLAPWVDAAEKYQRSLNTQSDMVATISQLKELRQKTELLSRALERELSIQMISASNTSLLYLNYWTAALLLSVVLNIVFCFLVWRWTQPLSAISAWFKLPTKQIPPQAARKNGYFADPLEVRELMDALRTHVQNFSKHQEELERRSAETRDSERAVNTLFVMLGQVMQYNQKLVDELLQKERLASMGEMAAQLAHEIRNPLNSMNLKLELLRDELNNDQQKVLDRVISEIDRLDALTESHLRTTRASSASLRTTRLGAVVQQVIESLGPELEFEHIQVEVNENSNWNLEDPIPENVLKAVIINLIKNAREALNESQGTNRIIAVDIRSGKDFTWAVDICDTGKGFPQEFLSDPVRSFRTTKVEGSGLGLATSQKMLQAYGIKLQVEAPWRAFSTRVSLVKEIPVQPAIEDRINEERTEA